MGDASLVVRPSEDRLSVCTPQGSVLCHRRFAVTENPWFGYNRTRTAQERLLHFFAIRCPIDNVDAPLVGRRIPGRCLCVRQSSPPPSLSSSAASPPGRCCRRPSPRRPLRPILRSWA